MSGRVVIIHPYVPAYRREFYQRVSDVLAARGTGFLVASNTPPPRLEARVDAVEAPWAQQVSSRWFTLGSKDLGYRDLAGLDLGAVDLVVVEQAIKNLESVPLLLGRRAGQARVAMWGHGRSYSTRQGPVLAWAKQSLTRRADWFFAYTPGAARHVVQHGFPPDRVTVVWNTIDTDGLRASLDGLNTAAGIDASVAFQRDHGLTRGRTALFLGGVDEAKGIDFLLDSATVAARMLPGFVLLVGGAGAELEKVAKAQADGQPVRSLGRIEGQAKAMALRSADVLAVPEWIGLVAVDSLVAGRPIVSTDHVSHSPEREYLDDGRTAVFSAHDPVSYAVALTGLLGDVARLHRMQASCLAEAQHHHLDRSVRAFVDGLAAWGRGHGIEV